MIVGIMTKFILSRSFEQGGATGAGIRNQPRLPGEGSFMLTQYISWCDKLHAAIDCYSWAFSSAYLAPSEVFSCECLNIYWVSTVLC